MLTKGIYQLNYTKTCVVCGVSFYPSHHKNAACSRKCGCVIRGGRNKTNPCYVTCAFCAKDIITKASKIKRHKSFFCDKDCMAEWAKVFLRGKANPNYKNAGWKLCQGCGNKFRSYNTRRKFCSNNCAVVAIRGHPLYAAKIGLRYERLCARTLEKMGFIVGLTKASRGPFDVIAFNGQETLFVQVKKTNNIMPSPSSYKQLKDMHCHPDMRKEVWINDPAGKWVIRKL